MMHIFDYTTQPAKLMTPEIVRLLNEAHERRGRVDIQVTMEPAILPALREIACIQSTGASNRIEGIITTDSRLKSLMQKSTAPRNRSEEEIAGYRDVLKLIHENFPYIPVTPSIILQLHRDLYSYSGHGGTWKETGNVITEKLENGEKRVRFTPVPSYCTPDAVENLCREFQLAQAEVKFDGLLLIAMFILDFLCIHPFRDGNGRMSRLLTTLLLSRSTYDVGRYISLEQLVDSTKDGYYEALHASSQGWHENGNDYEPFVRYFLGIVVKAYAEMEERMRVATARRTSKADKVRMLFASSLKPLRKADILEQCPGVSQITIERALRSLLAEGYIIRLNKGRSTAYMRNGM